MEEFAMNPDEFVRKALLQLLRGGNAHMPLETAVADFPTDRINAFPPNVSYTPWQLLEHVRIAQRDILDFIRDPAYQSPEWPAGYWPPREQQANPDEWRRTIDRYRDDRHALEEIVANSATDLYQPLAHGQGQNILREILVVSDHTAYHLGEFAILRQVMQTWPAGHDA
jgi:hypothetical protein